MKNQKDGYGYNERLFSGGVRSRLHRARFDWVVAELAGRKIPSSAVLELGCFDGKLLDFLPAKPARYAGFDANWEGGLDVAKERWMNTPNYTFTVASRPEQMVLRSDEVFGLAVAMETMEHIPAESVDGYLQTIAEHLDGYFLITVPNEKGIVFLAKWLVKKLLSRDAQPYSLAELANATLGRMSRVARREHKGFDYAALAREVQKHFDVVDIGGIPAGFLPASLCFGVGIVARTRRRRS